MTESEASETFLEEGITLPLPCCKLFISPSPTLSVTFPQSSSYLGYLSPGQQTPATGPAVHGNTIQRGMLFVKLPKAAEQLAGELPLMVPGSNGTHLAVLPSDTPCSREDALMSSEVLQNILKNPLEGPARAIEWRSKVLQSACSQAWRRIESYPIQPTLPENDLWFMHSKIKLSSELQTCKTATCPVIEACPADDSTDPQDSNTTTLPAEEAEMSAAAALVGVGTIMAELVRQVEVECAERGHVLARTWNLAVGLLEGHVAALHQQVQRLSAQNAAQEAQLDFLEREAEAAGELRLQLARKNLQTLQQCYCCRQ